MIGIPVYRYDRYTVEPLALARNKSLLARSMIQICMLSVSVLRITNNMENVNIIGSSLHEKFLNLT